MKVLNKPSVFEHADSFVIQINDHVHPLTSNPKTSKVRH